MKLRSLGKCGLLASEIGLGCEHLQGKPLEEVQAVVDSAIQNGINIFDVFMSEPQVRTDLGIALKGKRDKVLLQGHIGATWQDGQYTRSRNLEDCKHFFQDFLERLQTDYVDIGMIHYVDTEDDFEKVFHGDIIQYALDLKKQGVIKAIGLSSHNPIIATKAVETGLLDVLMFSINPAYDILPENTDIDSLFVKESYQNETLNGTNPVREHLYKTCEAKGTGITVMKSLAAGALLKAETSPFGTPLTAAQCIHYSLTRPAVSSVLVGCKTLEEVKRAVAYEEMSDSEKDYSVVLSQMPKYSLKGHCMYCNHCLPCPAKIDIAQVNKFLDLALVENHMPESVKEHYKLLEAHASDCLQCGSCESNCPFDVKVIEKMQQAQQVFGV